MVTVPKQLEEAEELNFEKDGLYRLAHETKMSLYREDGLTYEEIEEDVSEYFEEPDNFHSPEETRFLDEVLEELEQKDWVEESDGEYKLDEYGETRQYI